MCSAGRLGKEGLIDHPAQEASVVRVSEDVAWPCGTMSGTTKILPGRAGMQLISRGVTGRHFCEKASGRQYPATTINAASPMKGRRLNWIACGACWRRSCSGLPKDAPGNWVS